VTPVLVLRKLAGFVELIGEKGNGESEDDGECDNGVLPSEGLLFMGRWIWEGGRGIGTPCDCGALGSLAGGARMEVDGEDALDSDLRCVGCE
jgi:hypothetical protein